MAKTNTSPANRIAISASMIPIFTGKPTDLKPWIAALKKKELVYKLTDAGMIKLAYDYSDGIP